MGDALPAVAVVSAPLPGRGQAPSCAGLSPPWYEAGGESGQFVVSRVGGSAALRAAAPCIAVAIALTVTSGLTCLLAWG